MDHHPTIQPAIQAPGIEVSGDWAVEKSGCNFTYFRLAGSLPNSYFVTMLTDARVTIGFLLHDVSRQMRYAFDLKARDLGVTRQQWRALISLAHNEGQTQTELADALDVERISVGRMVDRLVDNGLVERQADPADRRVWRLYLLPAAYDIVNRLTDIGQTLEADVLDNLPTDKRLEFVSLLEQIRQGLKRVRTDYENQRNVA